MRFLKSDFADEGRDTYSLLLREVSSLEKSITPQGLANIFWALGTMGDRWEFLPLALQSTIGRVLRRFNSNSPTPTPLGMQSIASIVNGLAKLDFALNSGEKKENQHHLEESLLYLLSAIPQGKASYPHEIAVLIHSLAKIKLMWSSIPAGPSNSIRQSIERSSFKMSEQEIGNVVWGLGQMGVDFTLLEASFREALLKPVVLRRNELRLPALMGVLQGLEKGKLSWKSIHPALRQALSAASLRILVEDTGKGAGVTLLHALGRLQTPWNTLPKPLTSLLLEESLASLASFTNASAISCQKTSQVFNGLACMYLTWSSLDAKYTESLLDILVRNLPSFTSFELSSTVWALARMGVTIGMIQKTDLLPQLMKKLALHLASFSPGELAWLLWALGKFEIQFKDLELNLQQAMMGTTRKSMIAMSSRERGVTFWAFARMAIPLNDLSPDERALILQSIEELAMQSLEKAWNNSRLQDDHRVVT